MNDIIKKLKVEDIYQIKNKALKLLDQLYKIDDELRDTLEILKGYRPYDIRNNNGLHRTNYENWHEKYLDQVCWNYLMNTFEFQKYMLCTDYEKMRKEIDDFQFDKFTIENGNAWLDNIKILIYDNVNKLVKKVFENITNDSYYTGSGASWKRTKKKRNNNGIDHHFILTTYDYSRVFGYEYRPTITYDLEKVCYILAGEKVPEQTIISKMKTDKISDYDNGYFRIKVCKNGNTHYWINEDIRKKLNLFGSGRDVIGENIRIKILD
jgi:hypothetical protein